MAANGRHLFFSNNIGVDPGYPLNVIPTERSDESSVRQHKQRWVARSTDKVSAVRVAIGLCLSMDL